MSPANPTIRYTSHPSATLEDELNALVAIYRFCLFDSQARKGGPNDLTSNPTTEIDKNGPRKTEMEKT